jgi:hypothetical protein
MPRTPYKLIDVTPDGDREILIHNARPLRTLQDYNGPGVLAVQMEDSIELWALDDVRKITINGVLEALDEFHQVERSYCGWVVLSYVGGIWIDPPSQISGCEGQQP